MMPSLLSANSASANKQLEEVLDRTTMTHGNDGMKVPSTGYSSIGIIYGSLANSSFRSATILVVSSGLSNLNLVISGNRAQNYIDRIECALGTFDQSAATWAYNGTGDYTSWGWASGSFSSSGTSTLDLIYLE